MTLPSTVQQFLADAVDHLPDDHFTAGSEDCDQCPICLESAHAPTPDADSPQGLETTSSTAVVKTRACGHSYHQQCLEIWLLSQLQHTGAAARSGSCPMCRSVLIEPAVRRRSLVWEEALGGFRPRLFVTQFDSPRDRPQVPAPEFSVSEPPFRRIRPRHRTLPPAFEVDRQNRQAAAGRGLLPFPPAIWRGDGRPIAAGEQRALSVALLQAAIQRRSEPREGSGE
jgi:hypothetical protein